MNHGVLGFPPGRGIADAQSVQAYGGPVSGPSPSLHFVNLPMPLRVLVPGLAFTYTPQVANTGPVLVFVNGIGPLRLVKNIRTTSTAGTQLLRDLEADDLAANRSISVVYRDGLLEILTGAGANYSRFGIDMVRSMDAAAGRTVLELGTSATINVGTGPNNIVQLNGSAELPAVSGANLTGVASTSLNNLTTIGATRIVRAWANFFGSNGAIQDSLGVSGIVRNFTGNYTVTLNPALPNADYAVTFAADVQFADIGLAHHCYVEAGLRSISEFKILTTVAGVSADIARVSFMLAGG